MHGRFPSAGFLLPPSWRVHGRVPESGGGNDSGGTEQDSGITASLAGLSLVRGVWVLVFMYVSVCDNVHTCAPGFLLLRLSLCVFVIVCMYRCLCLHALTRRATFRFVRALQLSCVPSP